VTLRRSQGSPSWARLAECQSVFFKLLLERHHIGFTARFEDFLRALIAERAVREEGEVGTITGPRDITPLLHGTFEIGDSPKLSIGGRSDRPEELTRRVLVELRAHALALGGGQFGPIASHAPIDQPSETLA